jgi:hypothetical protein
MHLLRDFSRTPQSKRQRCVALFHNKISTRNADVYSHACTENLRADPGEFIAELLRFVNGVRESRYK